MCSPHICSQSPEDSSYKLAMPWFSGFLCASTPVCQLWPCATQCSLEKRAVHACLQLHRPDCCVQYKLRGLKQRHDCETNLAAAREWLHQLIQERC